MDLCDRKCAEEWEKDPKHHYSHALSSSDPKHTKRLFTKRNCSHDKNDNGECEYCDPCKSRTEFQRDTDRILHSRAFRRLMHKTQVFIQPPNEEFRTRLSHTLEVVQISRAIARALKLNEVATEAIALGHDLGHTPFGHAGEDALRDCMLKYASDHTRIPKELKELPNDITRFPRELANKIEYCHNDNILVFKGLMSEMDRDELLLLSSDPLYNRAINELYKASGEEVESFMKGTNGFEHNEQSIRVVDLLEEHYYLKKDKDKKRKGFFGLNLTYKVREGICTHTTFKKNDYNFSRNGRYDEEFQHGDETRSLEAQVVDTADGLAYTCHDLEDAINFGILERSDIPKGKMRNLFDGKKTHDRLRLLIKDVIDESKKGLDKIEKEKEPNLFGVIIYSEEYRKIMEGEKGFKKLYRERIYQHPFINKKAEKAREYIKVLFEAFVEYYEQSSERIPKYFPQDTCRNNWNNKETVALAACDEIASLTDNQAIYYFEGLNSPESFKGWTGWFGEFVPSHV